MIQPHNVQIFFMGAKFISWGNSKTLDPTIRFYWWIWYVFIWKYSFMGADCVLQRNQYGFLGGKNFWNEKIYYWYHTGSLVNYNTGSFQRTLFQGSGLCFMNADSVSWEQNMFHGDGFCLMRVKVQNISAMAPKCHENQRSVVACSNYVQRQW